MLEIRTLKSSSVLFYADHGTTSDLVKMGETDVEFFSNSLVLRHLTSREFYFLLFPF